MIGSHFHYIELFICAKSVKKPHLIKLPVCYTQRHQVRIHFFAQTITPSLFKIHSRDCEVTLPDLCVRFIAVALFENFNHTVLCIPQSYSIHARRSLHNIT